MDTSSKAARAARAGNEAALITSRDNRWLKEFRMALRGGLPTESGFVGVEGVRLVEEALRSGCSIQAVLFSESGQRHHERLAPLIDRPEMGFPTLRTTDRLFEGLADTEHPQGVAALVKPRETSFDDLVRAPLPPALPFSSLSPVCRIPATSALFFARPRRLARLAPPLPPPASVAPPALTRRRRCAPPPGQPCISPSS